MAFSFSVPSGWTLNNTPSQVVMISKDENAAMILQAEKTQEKLPDYAKKKAAEIEGGQLVSEDHLTVRGLSSYHQLYNISQENAETLRMRLSLIRKGAFVYSFSALAPASGFNSYDPDFRRSTQSFAEVRDTPALRRNPLRVRIIEANGRQSLQEILAGTGLKKDMWPVVAVLNGMQLGTKPPSGQLVKIIN
jgi:predicted Zn-dependent protease